MDSEGWDVDRASRPMAEQTETHFALSFRRMADLLRDNHEQSVCASREENAQWEHRSATKAANDAFRPKNYAEVVGQLESVQDRLLRSQIKKLVLSLYNSAIHIA